MLRGVIFDLDGTLITLQVDGAAFRREITRELKGRGFRMETIESSPKSVHVQDVLDLARAQIDAGLVTADYDDLRSTTFRALDALELDWIRSSRLLPGVAPLLSSLSGGEPRVTLALLTNSGRAATRYALDALGFRGYFARSFTRDDLPAMKPRPDGIVAALAALGLDPSEALYVGDSPTDIIASKGAGVRVASVPTGHYSVDALRSHEPDYVLESLSELEDLLSRPL